MADKNPIQFGASFIGRLTRTDLPTAHGLQPLFEAVSNSMHAIEDSPRKPGSIIVRVIRDDGQGRLKDEVGPLACRPIKAIHVQDDGVGFNYPNFTSFRTADSLHKLARGGKGIGRLLWLKAFEAVEVDSVFEENGELRKRTFRFEADDKSPIKKHSVIPSSEQPFTEVRLLSFKNPYKEACRHKPETLADRLIRHYLLQLIRPNCPSLLLKDDDADADIDLRERFETQRASEVEEEAISIGGHDLTVLTVRARSSDQNKHRLHLCADGYEVNAVSLDKRLPHLPDKLPDAQGGPGTRLSAYVSGKLLDDKVNERRTGFNLPRDGEADLIDPSEETIIGQVCSYVARKLDPILANERERSRQRIRTFITERRQVYRPLLEQIDDHLVELSQCDDDNELDIRLNTLTRRIEIAAETEFGSYRDTAREQALTAYKQYLAKVDAAAQVRLSQYVIRRRAVLYALRKLLESRTDGTYELEADVHDLIFPMGKTSDDVLPDRWNLWVIDERLSFHDHLASDKKLKSVEASGSNSGDEPDLIVFNRPAAFAEGFKPSYDSIVVIDSSGRCEAMWAEMNYPMSKRSGT